MRTTDDIAIRTRAQRSKLAPRREPYWRSLNSRLALGYRSGEGPGSWIARWYEKDAKRRFQALGQADDEQAADGQRVLNFDQAEAAARQWLADLDAGASAERLTRSRYTVADAVADYLANWEGKSRETTVTTINAHILPKLGELLLPCPGDPPPQAREKLKTLRSKLEAWRRELVERKAGKLEKSKSKGANENSGPADALRRHRATANRIMTILKAALNARYAAGRLTSREAWDQTLKPYRQTDSARIRYLTSDECQRLIAAAPVDFAKLLTGALHTGARYSELAKMRILDFSTAAGAVLVPDSKSGKSRHILLDEAGIAFFASQIAGRGRGELIFPREDGGAWGKSHQQRPITAASEAAGISPPINFHALRHTDASLRLMAGAPMKVIADNLGHADMRMVERHYGHLSDDYRRTALNETTPAFLRRADSVVTGDAKR